MLVRRILMGVCLGFTLLFSVALAQDAPQRAIECERDASRCARISIIGDPVSTTPSFSGHADPALVADPTHPERIWMAYTFLQGRPARGANGRPVGVPHTSTHLAVSDDRGATWRLSGTLWNSDLVADPEGQGPASYFGSETPSLAATRDATGVTWYSVRLSYFLEPVTAYRPRYAERLGDACGQSAGSHARGFDQRCRRSAWRSHDGGELRRPCRSERARP